MFSTHGLRLKNDNYRRFDANRPAYFLKIGLKDALEILKNVKGISRVEFNQKDIVRHKLVQRIVDAYEQNEENTPKSK